MIEPLISTQWLAEALNQRDLRVVDATWDHDAERHPRDAFIDKHIPGAVFLDLDRFADPSADAPMMMPPPAQFASRMQALGLGDGVRIILYDHSPLHTAARTWWMMRHFGVRDVAILDGGIAKWIAEGRSTEAGEPMSKHRHFIVRDPLNAVRTIDDMRANLSSRAEQVADARPGPRFRGEEPDLRPGTATGHIPGARNVPASTLFADDGTWKRGDALASAFETAGVDLTKPIVTSCGSGITAAVLSFGAHLLGREAALYDGSWAEWGKDPATPKATGAA